MACSTIDYQSSRCFTAIQDYFSIFPFCVCPFPPYREKILNVFISYFGGWRFLIFPQWISLIIFFPVSANPLFLYYLSIYFFHVILSSLLSFLPLSFHVIPHTFPFFFQGRIICFLKLNAGRSNIQLGMFLYICLQLNI